MKLAEQQVPGRFLLPLGHPRSIPAHRVHPVLFHGAGCSLCSIDPADPHSLCWEALPLTGAFYQLSAISEAYRPEEDELLRHRGGTCPSALFLGAISLSQVSGIQILLYIKVY